MGVSSLFFDERQLKTKERKNKQKKKQENLPVQANSSTSIEASDHPSHPTPIPSFPRIRTNGGGARPAFNTRVEKANVWIRRDEADRKGGVDIFRGGVLQGRFN
ncbi:hypothetical protein OUZ56_027568 [Daphnia magna]|uniref:Uncharacterized protein n=1 Tax=Daphnia magna TaxID=35525 RepID=A0ABR0B1A0_9CRUS|nr:hypothetical protein OUZ56_027568 [Daphnia magna]